MTEPVKTGIVGCGMISERYFRNLTEKYASVEVTAAADLITERVKAMAEKFGVPKVCSLEEMLADPEIKLIVNLTTPKAHAPISEKSILAGKSVYSEKPLAVTREDGKKLLRLAEEHGVFIGGAPDTFLGAGAQTCRKAIDDGLIGEALGFTAFMMGPGPDHYHPDGEFLYKAGGGPLFDVGPYLLTALVNLIGPVRRVAGMAKKSLPTRVIGRDPEKYKKITVDVPTHVLVLLEFSNGAQGIMGTSWEVRAHRHSRIDIYGAEGTLYVPDPNTFRGPVECQSSSGEEAKEIELVSEYSGQERGLGVAEMADAISSGRKPRAGGELTYHVLDVMHAVIKAAENGKAVEVESTCERPATFLTKL